MLQQALSNITGLFYSSDVMGEMIGTYTCVKGQDFVDFLINLGVSSTFAQRLLGTHWSMRIWKDEELWCASIMCKEMPHLGAFEAVADGVEKTVDHFMFGGVAKLVFRFSNSSDCFSTTCESEKFGKMMWEGKFLQDGAQFSFTGKGKTFIENWERLSRTEGAFIFKGGDNIEAYLNATGHGDMMKYIKNYKIHVGKKLDGSLHFTEYYGDFGTFKNVLELGVETPFHCPGDRTGEKPSCLCTMTRTSTGKYSMICKGKDGIIEECTLSFTDWGLVMCCTEKSSGLTCKFNMKRFRDMSGTFKLVSMHGFERFAKAMGISPESTREIMSDHTTKLVILDRGNGYVRHQLIRKKHPMDICFKLNEQFSYYHPMLKEVVKGVASVNRYCFCMVSKTSKGTLKSVMHFNDHFITWAVSLPEAHITTKMIFEWV